MWRPLIISMFTFTPYFISYVRYNSLICFRKCTVLWGESCTSVMLLDGAKCYGAILINLFLKYSYSSPVFPPAIERNGSWMCHLCLHFEMIFFLFLVSLLVPLASFPALIQLNFVVAFSPLFLLVCITRVIFFCRVTIDMELEHSLGSTLSWDSRYFASIPFPEFFGPYIDSPWSRLTLWCWQPCIIVTSIVVTRLGDLRTQ